MATGYEVTMVAVLAAMRTPTPIVPLAANIRRAHRTAMPREKGDFIHLIDGDDEPDRKQKCGRRRGKFTASIFVRSDDGATAADKYRIAVADRLETLGSSLPDGVMIEPPGRISPDTEIADGDATRVDMDFEFTYPTHGEWSLELPA